MKTPTRLTPADYERSRYFVEVQPGIPLSACLETGFWVHVHKTLKVLDVVELVAMDGSFDVEVRLVSKTPTSLRWRVLRDTREDAGPIEHEGESDYVVKHRGGPKFDVRHKVTGEAIAEGLSKQDAEAEKARLDNQRQAA